MRRAERLARVEAQLVAARAAARQKGAIIICDAFEAEAADGKRCVCALGAANMTKTLLSLSRRRIAEEWDSIEMGFDGIPWRRARSCADVALDRDFYRLGRRVRAAVKPVSATTLGAS